MVNIDAQITFVITYVAKRILDLYLFTGAVRREVIIAHRYRGVRVGKYLLLSEANR